MAPAGAFSRRGRSVVSADDLVIFDCDGTLVDSEVMNVHAVAALLSGFGFPDFTYEFCRDRYKSLTVPDIVADAGRRTGFDFPDDMIGRIVKITRRMIPLHVTAIAGARDLIEAAAGLAQICVASNGERVSVMTELEHTGLMRHFTPEQVLTAEEFPAGKPDPAMFFEAARRFEVAPERCLVIEDGIPGVLAARAAGMQVWGFSGTAENPEIHAEKLAQAGAGPVFGSLIHMREALIGGKPLASAAPAW